MPGDGCAADKENAEEAEVVAFAETGRVKEDLRAAVFVPIWPDYCQTRQECTLMAMKHLDGCFPGGRT
ncbi:hypothetical protein V9L18_12415 [Pseudarthrobacter sp. CCNWLW217]